MFGLVLAGLAVGAMSLYMASLSGVMGKMGLVGGDFSNAIDANELARQLRSQQNSSTSCSLWQVAKKIPSYLVSRGEDRVVLSGELGGERIVCGVRLVQQDNVERGVYTIVKGLYYLESHYSAMRGIVENNKSKCELLGNPDYERWVESYLLSTQGRIHEVVLSVYKQVERSRARVSELCLD